MESDRPGFESRHHHASAVSDGANYFSSARLHHAFEHGSDER